MPLTRRALRSQPLQQMSAARPVLDRANRAVFDVLLRLSNLYTDKHDGITFLVLNFVHVLRALRAADEAPPPAASAASPPSPAAPGGAASSASAAAPLDAAAAAASAGPAGRLGPLGAGAMAFFEDAIANSTALFVEDALRAHGLTAMVDFVKRAEQAAAREAVPQGAAIPGFGPPEAGPVLADFGARWARAIGALQRDVAAQFGAHHCERDVLRACLSQLLAVYSRLLELLRRQGPEGAAMARDAVSVPAIQYEIKKVTSGGGK